MNKSTSHAPLQSSQPTNDQATADAGPSNSTSTSSPAARKTLERFTKQDIEFIVTWLEHPPNFTSVFGSTGQTVIGNVHKPRTFGYATLAQEVSKQSNGRLDINGKNMRERFSRQMKLYRDTKRKADATGFGVTPEDIERSIYTVAHKLESMCTCYARMDALFGHRPNITPLFEVNAGRVDVPVQEQDEDQQPVAAPQRSRRLIVEEEEDEEEINDGVEGDGGVESDGGVEIEAVQEDANNQDIDQRDEACVADTQDIDDIDNSFCTDADALSILSITPSVNQRQSKRQLSDTESQVSNKRSRITDRRKKPPTLERSSSPEMSRRSFTGVYEQVSLKKATALETIEEKRLELEAEKHESEKKRFDIEDARERKRQDMEESRERKRQDIEEERLQLEKKRQEMEETSRREALEIEKKKQDMEETSRREALEIEKRKLELGLSTQKVLLIQTAMASGQTPEQIEALIKIAFSNT